MNHLLKAMSFWVWGLIAIGLSVSMVSVSYRLVGLYRAHEIEVHADSGPAVGSRALTGLPNSKNKPTAALIDSQGIWSG